ncbi:hypothetical protein C8Q74DRAFT_732906 [Fomes fomentarius]|nr:hypothetical protein C8Q74DRAFT_732906 [Fomes fomentarius]
MRFHYVTSVIQRQVHPTVLRARVLGRHLYVYFVVGLRGPAALGLWRSTCLAPVIPSSNRQRATLLLLTDLISTNSTSVYYRRRVHAGKTARNGPQKYILPLHTSTPNATPRWYWVRIWIWSTVLSRFCHSSTFAGAGRALSGVVGEIVGGGHRPTFLSRNPSQWADVYVTVYVHGRGRYRAAKCRSRVPKASIDIERSIIRIPW